MKDGFIRVGAVTPDTRVADPAENLKTHIGAARAAALDGTRVLVYPELSLSTYAVADLLYQPCLLTACEEALRSFAEMTRELEMISFVGLPVRLHGKLYNCAAAVSGGRILGLVPKTHLPNYMGQTEARHFAVPSEETCTIGFAGQTVPFGTRLLFTCETMPSLVIAAEICEDLFVANPPSSAHAAAGATVIVNLAASDEAVGKAEYRRDLVKVQSARTISAYILANAGRGESGTDGVFSAHSVIASAGKIVAENKPFDTWSYIATEIDTEYLLFARSKTNTFVLDRGDYQNSEVPFALGMCETQLKNPPSATPFVPQDEALLRDRCELILNIQSHALAGRIERARAESVVLGVSGGLDSTLALLVAARAADLAGMKRRDIIAVTMPCFGTTHRTRNNAEVLSEKLGATLRVVDIKAAVNTHFADIGHDPESHDVVYENAQARERTQVLMDIANGVGGLVVGTGDLSELALGWATYNGDHMSMYGVNGGVPKTLLRHIVAFEANLFEKNGDTAVAEVLRDILATPVSPELLPPEGEEIAQCTEGIVGPYELHDFFLYQLVHNGYAPGKIYRVAKAAFAGKYGEDTIRRWLVIFTRRFFTQQFKRSCLPDGPRVGSVGLSPRGGWSMPSDASFDAWMKDLT